MRHIVRKTFISNHYQVLRNLTKKDELENKFRLHSNTEWKEYGMVSIKGFLKHGHGETTAFCHMPIAQQLIMSNFALSTVMLVDPVSNTSAQNLVQLIFKVKCLVNGLNLGFRESPYYGFTILNHFAPYKAHHSLPVSSGLSLLFPTATGVNNEFNTAGETIFIVRWWLSRFARNALTTRIWKKVIINQNDWNFSTATSQNQTKSS